VQADGCVGKQSRTEAAPAAICRRRTMHSHMPSIAAPWQFLPRICASCEIGPGSRFVATVVSTRRRDGTGRSSPGPTSNGVARATFAAGTEVNRVKVVDTPVQFTRLCDFSKLSCWIEYSPVTCRFSVRAGRVSVATNRLAAERPGPCNKGPGLSIPVGYRRGAARSGDEPHRSPDLRSLRRASARRARRRLSPAIRPW
jgi:hypothetical protein